MESIKQKASRLFLCQHNFVLGIAYHFAPFPQIADDIVNDVFVEFVEHANRWNLDSDVRPILIRLTRIAAIAHWREQTRKTPDALRKIAEYVQQVSERNVSNVDGDELFALQQCLHKLPPKSFQLLEMRYNEQQATLDIAAKLKTTDSTIRQALYRIRKMLRNCVGRVLKKSN